MTIESKKKTRFAYIDFISYKIYLDMCFLLFRIVDDEPRNEYVTQAQTTSTKQQCSSTNGKKIHIDSQKYYFVFFEYFR